ncbi:Uncharacterized protein PECH_003437 [Penicillium ucsense]|uniref:Tubulin-specific chaperone D C-terminal domain-containing protein n=1 Tax=Penicillium ucsense TaxID=2839758 RepID=A0A8J8W8X5_9EURO|nr:Uncharacterized protein PECM_000247 [Penicillium ucsense]KAF7739458.1 Uncharacterized protein PECH_003437 [Penicillium ucsense]
MDAAEDRDVKLQRASNHLVAEFSSRLPKLLWKTVPEATSHRTPRKWAEASKTEKLVALLEPFQEWPQLLDPYLQKLLPSLVDAFLAYLVRHRGEYGSQPAQGPRKVAFYPLPRAICRLLYTFCKVRGVKVISRFFNNEPKYLDSMLRAFVEWDSPNDATETTETSLTESRSLQWQERYVMLVWLSHLLLAPFDLASLSSDDIPVPFDNLKELDKLPDHTPMVARSLLSLAVHYINVSGKEREAATALLARLVLRGDMQALGFLTKSMRWAFTTVNPSDEKEIPSVYSCIGILSFIARLAGSGQLEDLAPLLQTIFDETLRIVQGITLVSTVAQTSALARKIVVKILRNVTVMALSLSERGNSSMADDRLSSIVEEAIDHFLNALGDKDTPVRFAASKALSVITLRLEPEMGTEIIEAVIGSLGENILYEKEDGTLITAFEARRAGLHSLKRNLSGVDAQRWQGLMLTLSHLLFRRAPPTKQLSEILQSLLAGLGFEQRSSTGGSAGTGVRDAACFGVWALSRKYLTSELQALQSQTIPAFSGSTEVDVLQKLAVELVSSACVDPSGNIRRGASAALQELVGRHPDTIRQGILLVQVVDYHAVARRSRAMIEVAKATACLDQLYWAPLVETLLQWRGICSPDAESRRYAAQAVGILSKQQKFASIQVVMDRLLAKLPGLTRSDVESRHGCMLSLAATVDIYLNEWMSSPDLRDSTEAKAVTLQVGRLWEVFVSPSGPTDNDLTLQSFRPELTSEASAKLITSLSQVVQSTGMSAPSDPVLNRVLHVLSLCVSRRDDISIETASEALSAVFPLLDSTKQEDTVRGWIHHLRSSSKLPTGRGQILAIGAVYKQLEGCQTVQQEIVSEMLRSSGKDELIEKRVAAVSCLAADILPYTVIVDEIAENVLEYLNDYTTDRRGDIGSLVRVEAISAVSLLLQPDSPLPCTSPLVRRLVGCLCRLSTEKLDKHFSNVSSTEYFEQLLTLYSLEWLRRPLLQGFITSATAGADGLIRATRSAFIGFVVSHDPTSQQVLLTDTIKDLAHVLGSNLQDDRYAIPAVDFLVFLIDSFVVPDQSEYDAVLREVFVLVQKFHFRSGSIQRLESSVKVYAALSRVDSLRTDVLKKLTGILLHPFPRVRACAADYLFAVVGSDLVKYEDWSAQPKHLKPKVEELRTMLLPVE